MFEKYINIKNEYEYSILNLYTYMRQKTIPTFQIISNMKNHKIR